VDQHNTMLQVVEEQVVLENIKDQQIVIQLVLLMVILVEQQ